MPETLISDRQLVRAMLRGDESAFDRFFQAYFPRLYRFALPRLAQEEHLAEDAAQQALCQALRKLDTYRGEAALFTWLCTFCRHEISALLCKRATKPMTLVDDAPGLRAVLEALSDDRQRPLEYLLSEELACHVHLALDHLPPRYGDALEWKYAKGLSVREIAVRLGTGEKAAESLLTRARQSFREGFAELLSSLKRRPEVRP